MLVFLGNLNLPQEERRKVLETNTVTQKDLLDEIFDFSGFTEDVHMSNNSEKVTKHSFVIPTTLEGRRKLYEQFYKKLSPNVPVNCQEIVAGNINEIETTLKKYESYKRPVASKDKYLNLKNCDAFKKERGYIDHPLTKEELDFPIAFGLLVFKQFEQVERLLRAIYRPQHFYCIHVDSNATEDTNDTFEVLNRIANCFDNVFVLQNRADLNWMEFSIVQAELLCLKRLWYSAKGWKYYINLTGQELPLKSNFEIVKILKAMDGANVVYGMKQR